MLERFRNNMIYKLISIFAAIVIWFAVFSDRNPMVVNIVTVPLEPRYLADNLVIANMPNNVNVRFQGNANIVDRVSAIDFRAHIPLNQVYTGINYIQVDIEPPTGVRVIGIYPLSVQVYIDQMNIIQMPVDIVLNGEVAAGYVLGNPLITPGQVLISGPGNFLEDIGRVFVNAAFDNLSEYYSQSLPVLVEDMSGSLIMQWVNVIPVHVNVLIPVIEEMPSRVVPVLINLIGEPELGVRVDRVLVYPATIKIYGSRDVIDETGFIMLEIDVTEIDENTNFEAALEFPYGITHASNESVQIILEVR